MSLDVTAIDDAGEWDDLLLRLPSPHILQSWAWGEIKEQFGWKAKRLAWTAGGQLRAAAQILQRRLPGPLPLRVIYCPKGPLVAWESAADRSTVLDYLEGMARDTGVIQLKIDPEIPLGIGVPGEEDAESVPLGGTVTQELSARGWHASSEHIQFANTVIVDLRPDEEEILRGMKQKTRYNVRLASRRGVQVRQGRLDDLDLLYSMYATTSVRDGFVIRSPAYYQAVWSRFITAGLAQPLIAEVEGQAIAALIVFTFGPTAWYLYGMSTEEHREKMPNHLLQWEAMRWAKSRGCARYDMWGAPDVFDEDDPMWGVFRFKDGFPGRVLRTIGPWDRTDRHGLYWAYSAALPKLLGLMRSHGRRRTRGKLD